MLKSDFTDPETHLAVCQGHFRLQDYWRKGFLHQLPLLHWVQGSIVAFVLEVLQGVKKFRQAEIYLVHFLIRR